MKLSRPLFVLLLFTSVVCAKNKTNGPANGIISADSVFKRSQFTYAHLKTYLDSGKIVQSYYNLDHPYKKAKLFKTAYVNTGDFNFEYYDIGSSSSLYTINRTAGLVKSWWGVTNKIETPAKLTTPLSAALGVSARSSTIVPALLLTTDFNEKSNIYHAIKNPVLNGEEILNGITCYKISGTERDDSEVTIWIATTDFLIRKIQTDIVVDPARARAIVKKVDSLMLAQHQNEPDFLKRDSIRKAKNKETEDKITAISPNYKHSDAVFKVNTVYQFFPYTLKKNNPVLFSFRPNREISL
jgi:hypothetical protein